MVQIFGAGLIAKQVRLCPDDILGRNIIRRHQQRQKAQIHWQVAVTNGILILERHQKNRQYAYIVSDQNGRHGLQIFNLKRLRNSKPNTVFKANSIYKKIHSAIDDPQ